MRTIEELRALPGAAEAELEAARRRTDLNAAAARKLMRAKEALKAAEKAARGAIRGGASRAATGVGAR